MNRSIPREAWPDILLDAWAETLAGLHMRLQIVGKIRLMQSPIVNHWWEAVFLLTSRGITSTPVPFGGVTVDFSFDFIDHELRIESSDGREANIPLGPGSVADFHDEVMRAVASRDLETAFQVAFANSPFRYAGGADFRAAPGYDAPIFSNSRIP